MDIKERKYNEVEAGEIVGLKPRTLQRRRLEGLTPRWIKCGRLVRYPESSLREFLEEAERIARGQVS